jgi:hypothetical protein
VVDSQHGIAETLQQESQQSGETKQAGAGQGGPQPNPAHGQQQQQAASSF